MQQLIYLNLLMLIQLLFVLKLETAKCLNCFIPDLRIVVCKIRENRLTHELENVKTRLNFIEAKMLQSSQS